MSLKKIRDNKEGFTLVELTVVLVILALLAAIMVPSMTGWIDKAREKQVILDARNTMLACQTVLSEEYASSTPGSEITDVDHDKVEAISPLAEGASYSVDSISDSYVITKFTYSSGTYTATYEGNAWTVTK